jgi:predicted PurR-regulated permease PerM
MRNFLKNKFAIIILLAVFFSFGFFVDNALACTSSADCSMSEECDLFTNQCEPLPSSVFPAGTASSVNKSDQMSAFVSSAGFSTTIQAEGIVSVIIRMLLSLLAIIFVLLMIFSGYQWMTAGGNEEQVKKAQTRIKNAVIGLVVVILAYAITAFVFKNLPGGPSNKTPNPIVSYLL